MKLVVWGLFTLCILFSQFTLSKATLLPTLIKVRDHVYNLDIGYDINVGIVIGDKFVVLIESGYGLTSSKHIVEAVTSLTDKPIKYVINLHMHNDHTGGNKFFESMGATVINQANVVYGKDYDKHFPASNRLHFKDKMVLELGNETIYLEHMNAHTFDDAAIYLKKGNVFFIGENIRPQYQSGPGVLGMESFRIWGEKAFEFINNDTTIVPAHGKAIFDKAILIEYRKNYLAWFNRFTQLFREGKTTEQMLADKTAREIATKMNLDNNPKYLAHYDYYASNLIEGNINVSQILSDLQLKEYEGRYMANGKHDVVIESLGDQLIIKQFGSILSWINPSQVDEFKVMEYNAGIVVFERDEQGQIIAIRTLPNERARNKDKYQGVFVKVE